MANVLLLRGPSQNSSDRYEICLKSSGYNGFSVPVLETVFTNMHDLKRIIRDGPVSQNYGGVIITSGRACEAWKDVVRDLIECSVEACTAFLLRWEPTFTVPNILQSTGLPFHFMWLERRLLLCWLKFVICTGTLAWFRKTYEESLLALARI